MIEYYNTTTSVTLELIVLSGGTTVTGRTPWVEIRDKDTGDYFDFASRTFTSTTVSSTAPLTSAIDGLYRTNWDVSGVFTSSHFIMVEYHDATALSIDDLLFRPYPLLTGDVSVTAAGGGNIQIKGLLSDFQKKRLFDTLDEIKADVSTFREIAIPILRGLMSRKSIEKKDIEFLNRVKERDSVMYCELLKILKLRDNVSSKEVAKKLGEYLDKEEKDKEALLKLLTEKLNKKAAIKELDEDKDKDDDYE